MLQTPFPPTFTRDPFADMRRMQSTMNSLFSGARVPSQSTAYPSVNFWASENSIVVTTELPGLTENDIELTVEDTLLSIRGTYPEPENGDNTIWHRRERSDGTFLRSIELPFRVNADHIDARFENGVLTIEMQRPENDKPKRIMIKST